MIFAPFGFRKGQVSVGPTPTPSPTPTPTPTPTPAPLYPTNGLDVKCNLFEFIVPKTVKGNSLLPYIEVLPVMLICEPTILWSNELEAFNEADKNKRAPIILWSADEPDAINEPVVTELPTNVELPITLSEPLTPTNEPDVTYKPVLLVPTAVPVPTAKTISKEFDNEPVSLYLPKYAPPPVPWVWFALTIKLLPNTIDDPNPELSELTTDDDIAVDVPPIIFWLTNLLFVAFEPDTQTPFAEPTTRLFKNDKPLAVVDTELETKLVTVNTAPPIILFVAVIDELRWFNVNVLPPK